MKDKHNPSDERLAAFLKANAPAVPPAGADLEQRILAAALTPGKVVTLRRRMPRWAMAVGVLAVAATAAFLVMPRPAQPVPVAEPDDATLGAFLSDNESALLTGDGSEGEAMPVNEILADLD